jgi:hypothetical protein
VGINSESMPKDAIPKFMVIPSRLCWSKSLTVTLCTLVVLSCQPLATYAFDDPLKINLAPEIEPLTLPSSDIRGDDRKQLDEALKLYTDKRYVEAESYLLRIVQAASERNKSSHYANCRDIIANFYLALTYKSEGKTAEMEKAFYDVERLLILASFFNKETNLSVAYYLAKHFEASGKDADAQFCYQQVISCLPIIKTTNTVPFENAIKARIFELEFTIEQSPAEKARVKQLLAMQRDRYESKRSNLLDGKDHLDDGLWLQHIVSLADSYYPTGVDAVELYKKVVALAEKSPDLGKSRWIELDTLAKLSRLFLRCNLAEAQMYRRRLEEICNREGVWTEVSPSNIITSLATAFSEAHCFDGAESLLEMNARLELRSRQTTWFSYAMRQLSQTYEQNLRYLEGMKDVAAICTAKERQAKFLCSLCPELELKCASAFKPEATWVTSSRVNENIAVFELLASAVEDDRFLNIRQAIIKSLDRAVLQVTQNLKQQLAHTKNSRTFDQTKQALLEIYGSYGSAIAKLGNEKRAQEIEKERQQFL